jgi:hypothetical protein
MTSQRARAYRRVMQTLEELGPAKLLPSEQERIRFASDTLVFCSDVADSPARAAFSDLDALLEHLIACGRWSRERAAELADNIWACGPRAEPALPAAA